MFLWCAIDLDDQMTALKEEVRKVSEELDIENIALLLPFHVSLRISFEIPDQIEEEVKAAVGKELEAVKPNMIDYEKFSEKLMKEVEKNCGTWDEDIDELLCDSLQGKKALRQANFMRIYTPAYKIPAVCQYVAACQNDTLQHDLLEALGWHGTAYTSQDIASLCHALMADEAETPAVRAEAQKTLKRIRPLE